MIYSIEYENWIYTAVVQQTTVKVGNNANHLFEYFKFNSAPCSFARDYYYFRVRFTISQTAITGSSPRYKLDIFELLFKKKNSWWSNIEKFDLCEWHVLEQSKQYGNVHKIDAKKFANV